VSCAEPQAIGGHCVFPIDLSDLIPKRSPPAAPKSASSSRSRARLPLDDDQGGNKADGDQTAQETRHDRFNDRPNKHLEATAIIPGSKLLFDCV